MTLIKMNPINELYNLDMLNYRATIYFMDDTFFSRTLYKYVASLYRQFKNTGPMHVSIVVLYVMYPLLTK